MMGKIMWIVCLSISMLFLVTPLSFAGKFNISLPEFVKQVKENNQSSMAQKMEWLVSQEAVKNAESIFEPQFISSGKYETIQKSFTAEEVSKSIFSGVTSQDEQNQSYEMAIETLVKTGGSLRLSNNLSILGNQYNANTGDEYESFVGISLKHPILKNAGINVTMANIETARIDKYIQYQAYRQNLMKTVFDAASAYWDLKLNQERLKIRKNSVAIAGKMISDNQALVDAGKMANTEVLEAKAGLMKRQSYLVEARQAHAAALNQLKNFVSSSESDLFAAMDDLDLIKSNTDLKESMDKAFSYFSEYLSAMKLVDREELKLEYTKNQKKPVLDFVASYGLSGIDKDTGGSYSDTFSGDNTAWALGLEFSMPIFGDRKAKSEYLAAKYRKIQARHRLNAIRVAVVNYIDTSIQSVHNTYEQAMLYKATRETNLELLDVEQLRFESGKSNSRMLLDREEELNIAWEAELESIVNYRKALLELELAQGTILLNYGIDVEESDLSL